MSDDEKKAALAKLVREAVNPTEVVNYLSDVARGRCYKTEDRLTAYEMLMRLWMEDK